MAKILENTRLSKDFFLLRAQQENTTTMGQFYMVRAWAHYPVLSRPISVYDADESTVSLLYKVVGEGTELFSKLRPGDDITLDGPYGNGFPQVGGRVAMVGGGVGIAPFYLAAKSLRNKAVSIDMYLGFSDVPLLQTDYGAVSDKLIVDVGGYVTDRIDPSLYDCVFCCGPEPMMRALHKKCATTDTTLYVSLENRMACGLGVCLVCSCKTVNGNRKACKDGPVFQAKEVFFDA